MNKSNKKIIGFWLYILSDCIMFICLLVSIIISKKNFLFVNKIFNYRIILIESILLLICSFLTINIIKFNSIKFCILNIIYSIIFLILEFKDLFHLKTINLNFNYNNYLSNYFLILIIHAMHVFISIFFCLNIFSLLLIKKKNKIIKIMFSIFWHFIHIIWLFIIITIYTIK